MSSIKDEFIAFRGECIWLRICYNTYKDLYESELSEGDSILLQSAPGFFEDLNNILIEYCLLLSSRITDPKGKGSKQNLTISYLVDKLSDANLLTEKIQNLHDELLEYRYVIVDARNKLIAHSDRDSVLKQDLLGAHKKEEAENFFENMQNFCDEVGCAVGEGPSDFRYLPQKGDVRDLLIVLKAGLAKKNLR